MNQDRHVLIDPDGTADPGLVVLIVAATGVFYETQAGGHYTMNRKAEGFLVPIGPTGASSDLREFFAKTFSNWPPPIEEIAQNGPPVGENRWSEPTLARLEGLISAQRIWHRDPAGNYVPEALRFDRARVGQATEAWIPVISYFGQGFLIWQNSD
jgi:Family of unknown function (DUF6210)